MNDWTLQRVGDSTLVLAFEERMDPQINARALAAGAAVRAARHAGVRDVVEGYCTVTVSFDPLRTTVERLAAELEAAAGRDAAPAGGADAVTLPVCYGGRHGPDLGAVAAHAGCSESEVIELHCRPVYRVYMLGFLPGFAYLGAVDPRIAMPRRARPRVRVPAGSVGIARFQTGVYPQPAPGGWQLVGRCPLPLFDPGAPQSFRLRPGGAVRFEPVAEDDYRRLSDAEAAA